MWFILYQNPFNMKKPKTPYLKIIAGTLVLAFLAQDFCYAAPEIASFFSSDQKNIDQRWVKNVLPDIPRSVAEVVDAWKAPKESSSGPERIVYLIQDAHTNSSAQKNIARLLELMSAETIFLEAGFGDESLGFLRPYATKLERQRLADSSIQEGLIQGSEYYDLTSTRPVGLYGVENLALYAQAVSLYRDVSLERERLKNYLSQVQSVIQSLKPRVYHPFLRMMDRHYQDFESGKTTLTDYVGFLYEQAGQLAISMDSYKELKQLQKIRKAESRVDFDQTNGELAQALSSLGEEERKVVTQAASDTALFKLSGQSHAAAWGTFTLLSEKLTEQNKMGNYPNLTHYFEYLNLCVKLDVEKILREKTALENALVAVYCITSDEHKLFVSGQHITLLKKMLDLSLTPEEFENYRSHKEDFNIAALTGFLNKKIIDFRDGYDNTSILEKGYEEAIEKSEAFYGLTFARDEQMIGHALTEMQNENLTSAALVAGGYHSVNLMRQLKQKGISYVCLRPQILQETNQKKYEAILLGQHMDAQLNTSLPVPPRVSAISAMRFGLTPTTRDDHLVALKWPSPEEAEGKINVVMSQRKKDLGLQFAAAGGRLAKKEVSSYGPADLVQITQQSARLMPSPKEAALLESIIPALPQDLIFWVYHRVDAWKKLLSPYKTKPVPYGFYTRFSNPPSISLLDYSSVPYILVHEIFHVFQCMGMRQEWSIRFKHFLYNVPDKIISDAFRSWETYFKESSIYSKSDVGLELGAHLFSTLHFFDEAPFEPSAQNFASLNDHGQWDPQLGDYLREALETRPSMGQLYQVTRNFASRILEAPDPVRDRVLAGLRQYFEAHSPLPVPQIFEASTESLQGSRLAQSQTAVSPEEITDARAVEFYRMHRELLALFSEYNQAKKSPTPQIKKIKAFLSQVRSYAERLAPYEAEIRESKDEDAAVLASFEGRSPPELKRIESELSKEIKSYHSLFTEAHANRNESALDDLNHQVIVLLKRRLKIQLLRLQLELQQTPLRQGPIYLIVLSIVGIYHRLSYEHLWRTRRKRGQLALEGFHVGDATGHLAFTLYYERQPVLRVVRSAAGKVALSQIIWKKVTTTAGTDALMPVMTPLKFESVDPAFRSRLHAIVSQEEDYTQLIYHDLALEDVSTILEKYKASPAGMTKDIRAHVTDSLESVLAGPHGKNGLRLKRARVASDTQPPRMLPMPKESLESAVTLLANNDIRSALDLIKSTRDYIHGRLGVIEKIRIATARKKDYLYLIIRDGQLRKLLSEINTTVANRPIDLITLKNQMQALEVILEESFQFVIREREYINVKRMIQSVLVVYKNFSKEPADPRDLRAVVSQSLADMTRRAEARVSGSRLSARVATLKQATMLKRLSELILWTEVAMIDWANRQKTSLPGVGGHEAAAASSLHIIMALELFSRRGEDHVAHKPHSSPAYHALQYFLGQIPKEVLFRLRENDITLKPSPYQELIDDTLANSPPELAAAYQAGLNELLEQLPSSAKTDLDKPGLHSYPGMADAKLNPRVTIPTGSVGLGPAAVIVLALVKKWLQDNGYTVPDSHFFAVLGDAEFEEGNLQEILPLVAEHKLSGVTHIVDYNRQSLDGNTQDQKLYEMKNRYASTGWKVVELKWGGRMKAAFAKKVGGKIFQKVMEDMSPSAYQALLAKTGAQIRAELLEKNLKLKPFLKVYTDAALKELWLDLGGHDLMELTHALEEARSSSQATVIIAHTIKGWGLDPLIGKVSNHSALLNKSEMSDLKTKLGIQGISEEDPFPTLDIDSTAAQWLSQVQARLKTEENISRQEIAKNENQWPLLPTRIMPGIADGMKEISTQAYFSQMVAKLRRIAQTPIENLTGDEAALKSLAERVVTLSPDVGTSTGLRPKGAVGGYGPNNPKDNHFRFSIAEMNSMTTSAGFGKSHDFFGVRTIPVQTIYEMFWDRRALDPFFYAQYWGSSFIQFVTPSGATLSSEGVQHQGITGVVVAEAVPNSILWDPWNETDLDFIFTDALNRTALGNDEGRNVVTIRGTTKNISREELMKRLRSIKANAGLTDEQILTAHRANVLAGGYRLVDYRVHEGYKPNENVVNIFAMGAMVPEALSASDALLKNVGTYANVIVVTSPTLLNGRLAEQSRYEHLMSLVPREERPFVPVVTVADAPKMLLKGIGDRGIGLQSENLGLSENGLSTRDPSKIYRHHGISRVDIFNAAYGMLVERDRDGSQVEDLLNALYEEDAGARFSASLRPYGAASQERGAEQSVGGRLSSAPLFRLVSLKPPLRGRGYPIQGEVTFLGDPERLKSHFFTAEEWMRESLANRRWGFYGSGKVRFRKDFATYPQMFSPFFGAMTAEQVFKMWQGMRRANTWTPGEPFVVIELGAGEGDLAHDFIEHARKKAKDHQPEWQDFYDALQYRAVEFSPVSFDTMRSKNKTFMDQGKLVAVHSDALAYLDTVGRSPVKGVVLSNEFLDALPAHQVRVQPDGQVEAALFIPLIDTDALRMLFRSGVLDRQKTNTFVIEGQNISALSKKDFLKIREKLEDPKNKTLARDLKKHLRMATCYLNARYFTDVQEYARLNSEEISSVASRHKAGNVALIGTIHRHFIKKAADALSKGYIFSIDYMEPSYNIWNPLVGQMAAFSGNKIFSDWVLNAGNYDVTYDPDATYLDQLGRRMGLKTAYFGSQSNLEKGTSFDLKTEDTSLAIYRNLFHRRLEDHRSDIQTSRDWLSRFFDEFPIDAVTTSTFMGQWPEIALKNFIEQIVKDPRVPTEDQPMVTTTLQQVVKNLVTRTQQALDMYLRSFYELHFKILIQQKPGTDDSYQFPAPSRDLYPQGARLSLEHNETLSLSELLEKLNGLVKLIAGESDPKVLQEYIKLTDGYVNKFLEATSLWSDDPFSTVEMVAEYEKWAKILMRLVYQDAQLASKQHNTEVKNAAKIDLVSNQSNFSEAILKLTGSARIVAMSSHKATSIEVTAASLKAIESIAGELFALIHKERGDYLFFTRYKQALFSADRILEWLSVLWMIGAAGDAILPVLDRLMDLYEEKEILYILLSILNHPGSDINQDFKSDVVDELSWMAANLGKFKQKLEKVQSQDANYADAQKLLVHLNRFSEARHKLEMDSMEPGHLAGRTILLFRELEKLKTPGARLAVRVVKRVDFKNRAPLNFYRAILAQKKIKVSSNARFKWYGWQFETPDGRDTLQKYAIQRLDRRSYRIYGQKDYNPFTFVDLLFIYSKSGRNRIKLKYTTEGRYWIKNRRPYFTTHAERRIRSPLIRSIEFLSDGTMKVYLDPAAMKVFDRPKVSEAFRKDEEYFMTRQGDAVHFGDGIVFIPVSTHEKSSGARLAGEAVYSDKAPAAVGAYPHARRYENMLFVSGMGPRQRGATEIPGGTLKDGKAVAHDIEAQMRSTFENLRYILEAGGFSWKEILKMNIFLTHRSDTPAFERLWREYFPTQEHQPSRSITFVTALPTPIAFEVNAVAVKDSSVQTPLATFAFMSQPSEDAADQIRKLFNNVKATLALDRILSVSVSLADMKYFKIYNEIWTEVFSDTQHQPARTTVAVGTLPEGVAILIKVITVQEQETTEFSGARLGKYIPRGQLFNAVAIAVLAAFAYWQNFLPLASDSFGIWIAKTIGTFVSFGIISDTLAKRSTGEPMSWRAAFRAAAYGAINGFVTMGFFWGIDQIPNPIGNPVTRALLQTFILSQIRTRVKAQMFHTQNKAAKKEGIAKRRYESLWLSRLHAIGSNAVVQWLPFWVRGAAEAIKTQWFDHYFSYANHDPRPSLLRRPELVKRISNYFPVWMGKEQWALMVYGLIAPFLNLYDFVMKKNVSSLDPDRKRALMIRTWTPDESTGQTYTHPSEIQKFVMAELNQRFKPDQTFNILDAGAGADLYTLRNIKSRFPNSNAHALDILPIDEIDLDKEDPFVYHQDFLENTSLLSGSFQAVVSTLVLDFIEHDKAVQEIHRLLAEDGVAIVVIHQIPENVLAEHSEKISAFHQMLSLAKTSDERDLIEGNILLIKTFIENQQRFDSIYKRRQFFNSRGFKVLKMLTVDEGDRGNLVGFVLNKVPSGARLAKSDQKILNAIASLQLKGKKSITHELIAQEAGLSSGTILNRKSRNSTIQKAVDEVTKADFQILSAIASLQSKGQQHITQKLIAQEAGLASHTITKRKSQNPAIRKAVDEATFFTEAEYKILSAIASLQSKGQKHITQKLIAQEAGLSPTTTSNRRSQNSVIRKAMDEVTNTDLQILSAIASLQLKGQQHITQKLIAQEAGFTLITIRKRKSQNSTIQKAMDKATHNDQKSSGARLATPLTIDPVLKEGLKLVLVAQYLKKKNLAQDEKFAVEVTQQDKTFNPVFEIKISGADENLTLALLFNGQAQVSLTGAEISEWQTKLRQRSADARQKQAIISIAKLAHRRMDEALPASLVASEGVIGFNMLDFNLQKDSDFKQAIKLLHDLLAAYGPGEYYLSGMDSQALSPARKRFVDSQVSKYKKKYPFIKIFLTYPTGKILTKVKLMKTGDSEILPLSSQNELQILAAGFSDGQVPNLDGALRLAKKITVVYTARAVSGALPQDAEALEKIYQDLNEVSRFMQEFSESQSRPSGRALHAYFTGAMNLTESLNLVLKPLTAYLDNMASALGLIRQSIEISA